MADIVIGICDDQEQVIDILKEHINSVMEEIGTTKWSILEYTLPAKLLDEVKQIDVLFLDIEMPEMDGIEVGKKVMSRNPECRIIMATSRIDRFKDAFRVNAMRFITKPFFRDEIMEALTSYINKQIGQNEIDVFQNRRVYKIKERDIKYVIAYNGYVEVIVGDEVFRKEVSLNDLENQFDKRLFCRVNRQVIVNYQYISNYDKKYVFVDDIKFNISFRKYSEFIKKYMEFDLNCR